MYFGIQKKSIRIHCSLLLLIPLLFGVFALKTHASTVASTNETYLYQINQLLAQVAILQSLLQTMQNGTTISPKTDTSIVITSPKAFAVVTDGDSYTVAWDQKNVPPSTMLLMETVAIQITGGSGVGGGTYQKIVKPGSSSDSWMLNTGVGYSDPGTYQVRLLLLKCQDTLCTQRPYHIQSDGKTSYDTSIIAETNWVRYSINESSNTTTNTSGISITGIHPSGSDTPRLGQPMTMSFTTSGLTGTSHKACFTLQDSNSKMFSPAEDDEARNGCVLVGNGTYSYTWTPQWLPGFQLNSGVYRVFVNIENPPNNSGKDYGSAAEASGVWFRLLPKY